MRDFVMPPAAFDERDMGTPARKGAPVTLTIDGFAVTVPAGTSVMRAAAEAGIQVPKLCATDSVEAFGSCRLCAVEIEGRRGAPASCTTPVAPGMVVHTQTEKLRKLRKGVMELYISDHPLDCLTCAANGDCELQDMAGAVGLRDVRYKAPSEGGLANHFAPRDRKRGGIHRVHAAFRDRRAEGLGQLFDRIQFLDELTRHRVEFEHGGHADTPGVISG
jgi:formate dehydrogenase major subunit